MGKHLFGPLEKTAFVLIVLSSAVALPVQGQSSTRYELTFDASWSATTHPVNFPGNPHFSGLIGALHNESVSFWDEGATATPGIKRMAEIGSKTDLTTEILVGLGDGNVSRVINEGGISRSPDSIVISFSVKETHPFLTLVSMLAPSPDWFVGVSSLPLRDENGWIDLIEIDLFAWDAGTDSGISYTSANQATVPPETISRVLASPMLVNGVVTPVGRFRIIHTPVLDVKETPVTPESVQLIGGYPNPFSQSTKVAFVTQQPGPVTLDAFDLQGRLVTAIFNGSLPSGRHEQTWVAPSLAPGIYVLRLVTPAGVKTSKIALMR